MSNTPTLIRSPRRRIDSVTDNSEVGVVTGWICPSNMPISEAGPMAWARDMGDKPNALVAIVGHAGLLLAKSPAARPFIPRRMKAVILVTDLSLADYVLPEAAARYASTFGTYTEGLRCVKQVRHVWLPCTLSPAQIANIAANELNLLREESPHDLPDHEIAFLVWRSDADSFGGGAMDDLAETIKEAVFPTGETGLSAFDSPQA